MSSLDDSLARIAALRDKLLAQERMRAAKRLLRRLRGRGVTLEMVDGQPRVRTKWRLNGEMAEIREYRQELIGLLTHEKSPDSKS